MDIDSIRTPTLYEVSKMKEDWGLEGEEQTHLVLFLSFIKGGFVIMTGLSSGGKNAVVNSAAYCTPGGAEEAEDSDWVYQVSTSLSKTQLYSDHEVVNSKPVHVHMDISSLRDKQFLEDVWKAHGEGKSITHSWTEVIGQERHSRSQTLHPPNCMVLFLAEDNQQVNLNDYAEVRNRALVVPIDDSQELTEKVNTRQAMQEAGLIEDNLTPERTEEIRNYVDSIPTSTYGDGGSGGMLNPVAVAIDEQNPLPQHFTEARRDFPRLLNFMEAVTLFHYNNRLEVPNKLMGDAAQGMVTMLVTPADAWLAMRVFGETMVLSALNLRDKHFELLSILRNRPDEALSADELQMEMRSRGYNITTPDVRSAMDDMQYKGYVRPDKSGSPVVYSATPFASKARRYVDLDWSQVVETTKETAAEALPGKIGDQYIDRFCEGEGLLVTHPFTGETVNLTEATANELQQKEEQLADEMDSQVFDNDDDEPDAGNDDGGLASFT
ncbi:hypothetical protein HRTV-2_gp66 [Halorubrum virus HRTV-2]|nr:hypothetical protein HRTV-2_gp66 [Halorubrum virus HRTV-2]